MGAAGAGITPVMSIVRDLPVGTQALVLYSVRSWEDIIFRSQLISLASSHLRVVISISGDDSHVTPSAEFVRIESGRISLNTVSIHTGDLLGPSTLDFLYVCGPGPFSQEVTAMFRQCGFLHDACVVIDE